MNGVTGGTHGSGGSKAYTLKNRIVVKEYIDAYTMKFKIDAKTRSRLVEYGYTLKKKTK
tara:strand:+ start:428 stop:604 length:177 start_codon:yes stop_codon:yes gene_type:complete